MIPTFFPIQPFSELSSEQPTSISSWIPQESQFQLTHNELTTSPCSESVCGFPELVIQSKNLGVIVNVIFFVTTFIQAVTKSCKFYLLKAFKLASSFHLCCLCRCRALTISVLNTYSSCLAAASTGLLPPQSSLLIANNNNQSSPRVATCHPYPYYLTPFLQQL